MFLNLRTASNLFLNISELMFADLATLTILIIGTMYFVCRAVSGINCWQSRAQNVATFQKIHKLYSRLGFSPHFKEWSFAAQAASEYVEGLKRVLIAKWLFVVFLRKMQKLCLLAVVFLAFVTRTLSSCGHGCSGHSHATKPRSVVSTDVNHPLGKCGKRG